jgi:hypothetical protein
MALCREIFTNHLKVAFRRLVYLTTFETGGYFPRHGNGALVQIMATSPPPTRLSVVVTQIKLITIVCLYIQSRAVLAFPRLTYAWQADKWLADNQYHSVHWVTHIHESWERDDDDQANVLQVCRSTNVCQINRSWERYGNYWLVSL